MKVDYELAAKMASAIVLLVGGIGLQLKKYGITEEMIATFIGWIMTTVGVLGGIRTLLKGMRRKKFAEGTGDGSAQEPV